MNIKKLFLILIVLTMSLCFLPNVWARKNIDYSQFQSRYGKDLKSVPFFLRQKFLNDNGKAWPKASIEEKGKFLSAYFSQKAEEDKQKQRRQSMKVRLEQSKEKKKYSKQRTNQRAQQQKQRVKQAELKKDQQRKKQFAKMVQMQKKKMQQMRQR